MNKIKLSEIPLYELLDEIQRRGLLTNSKRNLEILNSDLTSLRVILSYGLPQNLLKCRDCGDLKSSNNFNFYQGRVDNKGFLMRSNALCSVCSLKSNNERKIVLSTVKIPKPNPGDVCENCNRQWFGNWHRHHVGDKFLSYICGHCNMSFSDQRNKLTHKKMSNGI
jgi:hypothetical protein